MASKPTMDKTILNRGMANKVMGMEAIMPTGLSSITTTRHMAQERKDGDRYEVV
jgi:hypothetical protein